MPPDARLDTSFSYRRGSTCSPSMMSDLPSLRHLSMSLVTPLRTMSQSAAYCCSKSASDAKTVSENEVSERLRSKHAYQPKVNKKIPRKVAHELENEVGLEHAREIHAVRKLLAAITKASRPMS